MSALRRLLPLPLLACGLLLGCGDDAGEAPEPARRALFELDTSLTDDLFALPYPNDLRRNADGTIDLAGLSRWGEGYDDDLIKLYLDRVALGGAGGFALNGGAFFRFTTAIDPATLPADSAASLAAGSAVVWVNIDAASPDYGQRIPVRVKFDKLPHAQDAYPDNVYIGENNLAVLPVFGYTLAPATRYAVILTDAIRDELGGPVASDNDFARLLRDESPPAALAAAHQIYAPLRAYLAQAPLGQVISAAVFTTGDPTALAGKAREVIYRQAAPRAAGLEVAADRGAFYELRGTYTAPNFQSGTPPYASAQEGGEILLDEQGYPRVARTETLRFAVSIPRGEMPAAGWPVVIYAHGTGGDYRTFIANGVAGDLAEVKDPDNPKRTVAQLAVVGIDQNIHGSRVPPNTSSDVWFFNFQNPAAAVHNVVQAGVDDFSLLRLIKGLTAKTVPWGQGSGKSGSLTWDPAIKFDPKKIYFMGHSQGGLTGPVFLAYEPEVPGAVLSGAGGSAITSFLNKLRPFSIPAIVEPVIGEKAISGVVRIDEFHPILTLIQQMLEPSETANYGRMLIQHPAAGLTAKHVYLSQGLADTYTPVLSSDVLAAAMGLPQVRPIERTIPQLQQMGIAQASPPVTANLAVSGGRVTGGVVQYVAGGSTLKACQGAGGCKGSESCLDGSCYAEGHFVVFNEAQATRQYTQFLATLARDGVPTIVR